MAGKEGEGREERRKIRGRNWEGKIHSESGDVEREESSETEVQECLSGW